MSKKPAGKKDAPAGATGEKVVRKQAAPSGPKCPGCGKVAPDEAAFCPECGTALNTVGTPQAGMQTIGGLQTINPTPGGTIQNRVHILERGERVADRYVIKEVIGQGGMGVVYRAKDELTEKTVALKLIHPGRAASEREMNRLKQEGITARDIRHKYVVAVYDVGQCDGTPFITMEYLKGRSLRQWHRAWQKAGMDVPVELAVRVIHQILRGLQAAHERGVIHRDLKPENVMVVNETDCDLEIKILDFGIARACEDGPQTNSPMGTRGYMAPEQLTSPDLAGPAADMYALSVMFYELLMDVVPQGHWQPPSGGRGDVPRGLDQLIERGLSNRPQNRPQTAAAYMNLLKRCAAKQLQRNTTKSSPESIEVVQPIRMTPPAAKAGKRKTTDALKAIQAPVAKMIDKIKQPRKKQPQQQPQSKQPDPPKPNLLASNMMPPQPVAPQQPAPPPVAPLLHSKPPVPPKETATNMSPPANKPAPQVKRKQTPPAPMQQPVTPLVPGAVPNQPLPGAGYVPPGIQAPPGYQPGRKFPTAPAKKKSGRLMWIFVTFILLSVIGLCTVGFMFIIDDSSSYDPYYEKDYGSEYEEGIYPQWEDPDYEGRRNTLQDAFGTDGYLDEKQDDYEPYDDIKKFGN